MTMTGCSTLSYYKQAIQGEYFIQTHQQPIPKLLQSSDVASDLKEKLQLVLNVRDFAAKELGLPADGNYLNYCDLGRPYVVWNVYAAPEFSLEPKGWWYPFVGKVTYRGYFSEEPAQAFGQKLGKQGYDVYVTGIEAYSTLGWFEDPVLNTFIHNKNADVAAIIFHELTHHRLYVSGDTEFSEALATAVAEVGLRRWLLATENAQAVEKYAKALQRKSQFVALIMSTRQQLENLYLNNSTNEPLPSDSLRKQKQSIIAAMSQKYQELKAEWGGYEGYDDWFDGPLNNAQLNTVATYYRLVPAFHRMLDLRNGDIEAFFKDVKRLADLSKEKRLKKLEELLTEGRSK